MILFLLLISLSSPYTIFLYLFWANYYRQSRNANIFALTTSRLVNAKSFPHLRTKTTKGPGDGIDKTPKLTKQKSPPRHSRRLRYRRYNEHNIHLSRQYSSLREGNGR